MRLLLAVLLRQPGDIYYVNWSEDIDCGGGNTIRFGRIVLFGIDRRLLRQYSRLWLATDTCSSVSLQNPYSQKALVLFLPPEVQQQLLQLFKGTRNALKSHLAKPPAIWSLVQEVAHKENQDGLASSSSCEPKATHLKSPLFHLHSAYPLIFFHGFASLYSG